MEITGLKRFLGVLAAVSALGMGWGFWIYFMNGVVMVIPFMLGYIYVCVGLFRFQRWAFGILFTSMALSFVALFIYILGQEIDIKAYFEWLLGIFTWVSIITMSVFGICALIRKLISKK